MSERDKQGRFKDGHKSVSGGRPRKAKGDVPGPIFDFLLDHQPRDASTVGMDISDQIEAGIYRKAIQGDRSAERQVFKWIREREEWFQKRRKAELQEVSFYFEATEPTDSFSALRLLRIACPDPMMEDCEDLRALNVTNLLFSWVVQEAISRPGSKHFKADDVLSIESATLHPELLRWPRSLSPINRKFSK